jgi:GNAT superfamily N-acetyltransferase
MKHLDSTEDKFGNLLEIYLTESLAWSPVYALVLKTHLEIVEKHFAPPILDNLSDNTKVIWAQDKDGNILGGIAFTIREKLFAGCIELSFTAPEHRGKGINGICHKYFEQYVKNLGINLITSFVHVNNTQRLKSAEKENFKPAYYVMYKKI